MRLTDEEEIEKQRIKDQKIKKIIIILIVMLVLLGIVIAVAIIYRINNPITITTYIDGVQVQDFDQIVDFQTDENGEIELYIPIREFASYLNVANSDFGYQTFKGDYNPKTEDNNKCYVIRTGYEVAIFTADSKTIYKLNLQSSNDEYEECTIDKDVFESNGQLYASQDGIEQGYNVIITYNDKKKTITIYTMDYLIEAHQMALEGLSIGDYGEMKISDKSYSNWKSVFDGLLIVQSSSGKYGIIKTSDYTSFVLEPQYDSIDFINDSSTFLVESNGSVGLFSEDGKRKIDLIYDEITSMGQKSNLYMVKSDGQYGVVDENGNIIIYPQYKEVGIDVSDFSYNGVKNGYILLNKVIPVADENNMWAFFDLEGNLVTDGFIYQKIGCSSVKSGNNIYPLLEIEEYDAIVVQDEYGQYSFINTEGRVLLQFLFDQIYIKVSSGETSYWMTYKEKDYEVTKYLDQIK